MKGIFAEAKYYGYEYVLLVIKAKSLRLSSFRWSTVNCLIKIIFLGSTVYVLSIFHTNE